MSKHSQPQDSSILGESWVIASAQLAKEPSVNKNKENNNNNHQTEASDTTPRPTKNHHDNLTESISTSCESISGPVLIMPSINEAPICEGSWIAPTASPPRALRRRHQASTPSPTRSSTQRPSAKATESAQPTVAQHETINRRPSFTTPNRGFILRILLNVVLIAGISHLLVLPETVQQHQSLCSIPALATLYPASCIPLYLKTNNKPASISTQTPLETLLNNTLQTMAPHSTTLKHTESKLRDIHQLLKKQYPGSKHELDLEFTGCLEATRMATRRFDSLHADLRSAVDSLIAARGSGSGNGSGSGSGRGRGSAAPAAAAASTANTSPDARLSTTQLTRREQYVDQLTSRMQTKADSLLGDFATLDDHLESIAGVVKRETNRRARKGNDDHHRQGPGSSSSSGLKGMVGALFGGGSARSQPHTNTKHNEDNDNNDHHHHHDGEDHPSPQPPASSSSHHHHEYPQLPTIFQEAATRHQPVLDMIKKLSDGLQHLQNQKGGMFHS